MNKNLTLMHYLSKLQDTVIQCWDKTAVCNYRGESFSFGELAANIEKFHIFFDKAGLHEGDKVAVCAKNSARWAVSFLAANTYGTVTVPILADFLPDAIAGLVSHSDSRALFTDEETWNAMDKSALGGLLFVINVTDFTLLHSSDRKIRAAYDSIPESMQSKYPMGFGRGNVSYPVEKPGDLAVINYTSGTTSAPKGVMLSFANISASVSYGIKRLYVDSSDSVVSMLPMGHIYGLVFEFLYPLCHGASVCFFGKTPSPTLLLKAMADVKPYMVVSVPLVMEKIFKTSIKPLLSRGYMKLLTHLPIIRHFVFRKIGRGLINAFGGRVRIFIMGGAALNPEVENCFRHIKLPYMVGYGMTEAAPLLAYEEPGKYVPGSCGKAVDCTDIRIDSDDPQHIAGEIQAKGDNICSGYYKNPEATEAAFTDDGYLRTGDLGIMDTDGNIFIKGRSKNMILTANGQNIYPEEVEAVINSQEFVAESVVLDRASKLVALIYLDAEAIRKANLDDESIADIPEKVRLDTNRLMPPFSRIAKVEVVLAPFEKTPKFSIKRFLYK